MIAMREDDIREVTAQVVPLDTACFANVRSGELVLAARIFDSVLVADEYGDSWLMATADFDAAYEPSHICPVAH